MVKRMKYWKAGLVFLTALAFSIAASGPSKAASLAEVAQWYVTVYGTSGPAVLIGSRPAAASPTQVLPASTGTTTACTAGQTCTQTPVAPAPAPVTLTAQSNLLNYYFTCCAQNPPATATVSPATTTVPTAPASAAPTQPAASLPNGSAIWSGYSAGYSLNADEQNMLNLVNQQRVANHLPAFTVNLKLSYLARLRAQDMDNHQNLTHYSPTYGTPPQMEEAAGLYARVMGAENIVRAGSVESGNQALFNSAPHRANLLDPQETEIGLGIVRDQYGIWASQLFFGN